MEREIFTKDRFGGRVEVMIGSILKIVRKVLKNPKLKIVSLEGTTEDFYFVGDRESFEMSFSVSSKEKSLYIMDFNVKEKETGNGKKIIFEILKIFQSKGFKKVIIDPIADNAQAWSFWTGKENCGFKKVGQNTAEKIL